MSLRVAIVAIRNIRNIGDAILASATDFLVRRACPAAELVPVEFLPRPSRGKDLRQRVLNRVSRFFLWWAEKVPARAALHFRNRALQVRFGRFFRDAFRPVDAVLLSVGTFKYASQDHGSLYDAVSRAAQRVGRPVMLTAASVAAPDRADWRAGQLAKALKRTCWRRLATRDGADGVSLLQTAYGVGNRVPVRAVGDPALWLPEMTGVVRPRRSDPGVIGVNLVRGGIYETYRGGVPEERLLAFYGELLRELDRRGLPWRLFSNGTRSDERFGDLLCERYGLPPSCRLPPPASIRGYVETVVSFRAVFGARLHACLTATAFRVPSVWLDWDDKFVRVAEALGCTRRLIERDELDGRLVADRLETVACEPYDDARIASAKAATAEEVATFVDEAGRAVKS